MNTVYVKGSVACADYECSREVKVKMALRPNDMYTGVGKMTVSSVPSEIGFDIDHQQLEHAGWTYMQNWGWKCPVCSRKRAR